MNRIALSLALLLLAACGAGGSPESTAPELAAGDFERGPHRGRMLREGDFALEVTIYETNVPPQYRLYAYRDGEPLPPAEVTATVRLMRLDGEVNEFSFTPGEDHLTGSGEVTEPHSFDVEVTAQHAGETYRWGYASYEGRTTIPAAVASEAGVVVEPAGPATIRRTVPLMGTVALDASRHAQVRARFPGIVREVSVQEGQRVQRGQTLAVIEGNDSMRNYPVVAPFDGMVLARHANVGDIASENVLLEVADLSNVWVDLRALGADADQLAVGQAVEIALATADGSVMARIQRLLPVALGQGVVARTTVPNADGRWRPGMSVTASVTVSAREVPLAVKESGLQRFRDFTVVFAQVGETYEVRMLELGERDGRYAEVLGGLKPGTPYVSAQSFLIKADVEKSGASHDH